MEMGSEAGDVDENGDDGEEGGHKFSKPSFKDLFQSINFVSYFHTQVFFSSHVRNLLEI